MIDRCEGRTENPLYSSSTEYEYNYTYIYIYILRTGAIQYAIIHIRYDS